MDSFYFEKKSLSSLKEVLPPLGSDQIEASRQLTTALFKAEISLNLLFNLFRWGVFLLKPSSQNQLKSALLNSENFQQKQLDWKKLKSTPISMELIKHILTHISQKTAANMDQTGKNIVTGLKEILAHPEEASLKDVSRKTVDYLIDSIMTAGYTVKIREIVECFQEIESSVVELTTVGGMVIPNPSSIVKRFFRILTLEDYEQRLELLVEQAIQIFSENSSFAQEGKQLYQDLLGVEY